MPKVATLHWITEPQAAERFLLIILLMNLKRLNIAELFALWRVVSFPIILFMIFAGSRSLTAWLYLIFFSTDLLDGICANLLNMESERRARLDTLGDILYLLTGTVGYYVYETGHFIEHIWLIGGVLTAYLLQLILAISKWGKPSTYHTWLAKLAAFFQVVFLVSTFFFGAYWLFFYLAIGISLLDALEDIVITFLLRNRKSHLKGLPWLLLKQHKEKQEASTGDIH
jgi:phosphatidylglycerophosphate synthase